MEFHRRTWSRDGSLLDDKPMAYARGVQCNAAHYDRDSVTQL